MVKLRASKHAGGRGREELARGRWRGGDERARVFARDLISRLNFADVVAANAIARDSRVDKQN